MLAKPYADHSRKAKPLFITAACAFVATVLTGCASGPLKTSAPQGVDLSGEWRLNESLSDDPQHIGEEPKELPEKMPAPSRSPGGFGRPGTNMPGMPGGSGRIDPADPNGGGENLTRAGVSASSLVPVLYQSEPGSALPSSASDNAPDKTATKAARQKARDSFVSHMLDAPQLLTISQSGSKLIVKSSSDATSEEYTAGEQRTIPFGQTEADRSAGWRESAFVVITKAKTGASKEDDYALDSEGHLIFATLVTHVKKGPIDFKRVYDRVRTPH